MTQIGYNLISRI